MQKIVTLESHSKEYPCNKDTRFKYMVPIHKEKVGSVWYHTFKVTPYTNEEKQQQYIYGNQSEDWD